MDGLYDGYSATAPSDKQFSKMAISIATIGNDVGDIEAALSSSVSEKKAPVGGHCSALIKLLPGIHCVSLTAILLNYWFICKNLPSMINRMCWWVFVGSCT